MIYSYKTIDQAIENIDFKEKGSKFIGFGYPVEDEGEVKEKLIELWERFPDATHICYAYRLGLNGEIYRANDDGEPSGSAGLPIYNQIVSKEITNVLVASVRFYGGTKLGVSGLVKAYKLSAQMVLEEAILVEKHLTEKILIEFTYEDQGNVMRNIDKSQVEVLKTNFGMSCTLEVKVRKDQKEKFISLFEPLYQVKLTDLN
ncbi:IMPACT family protein [Moheibacter stercoris]|uniref:YigZ family protein n=1 Tax=Moheibacter stercoris TaxID=1628251 RepID=A0ABV2LVK6_9FLAO